jgi:type IV secretory pathway TrbD component
LTDELKEHRSLRTEAPPPPSEDIHLPGPSYLPIVVAAGIAVALVGLVWSWVALALGMVVWLTAAAIWLRRAREEMSELPLDHG